MIDRSEREDALALRPRPPTGEDAGIREALDGMVRESIRPVATGLAILYGLLVPTHLLLLPSPTSRIMASTAAVSTLLLVALRIGMGRWELPVRWAHPVGAAVAGVILANSLLHLFLTVEPRQTTNLILLVLGVGIVFLDVGWFALVVAAAFVGWFVLVRTAPTSEEWIHFGFALVAATVLSAAILVIRLRTFRRIQRLRFDERIRQLELETALQRTETARKGEEEARRAMESAVTQLTESEERFRRLAEATFEGVVIHQDGVIVDANHRSAELFGHPLVEVLDRNPLDLVDPEDRERLEELLDRGPAGEEEVVEARGVRRDGSRFPMELSVAHATYEGKPAMVTVIRDVTAQKRAEEVLRRAAREAEADSRQKSVFLANMSHELRTPLNAVIGFSNILRKNREDVLGERDLEYLDRIVSNGEHLLMLIDDLLDLSKIEAGRMDVVTEQVKVNEVIRDAVQSLELQARRKKIELRAEIPDEIQPLEADEQRLRQVLLNLVGNAVKFTSEGSVVVRVHAEPDTGRPLRIDVDDTGIGIPEVRLQHIFDAFQQVDSSTARRFGGTGLGLTISRSLCQLMGFELTARSQEGKGSTFIVDFDPPVPAPPAKTEGRGVDVPSS